jgi:3-hydroxybutyryl-CoA dehydratase
MTSWSLPDRRITQEQIHLYANVSGDHNPLHIDESYAKRTRFGGTIAHGMMALAFISELMTQTFGALWTASGELDVSFVGPVRPGDVISTVADLVSEDERAGLMELNVSCRNQTGATVIAGQARIGPQ